MADIFLLCKFLTQFRTKITLLLLINIYLNLKNLSKSYFTNLQVNGSSVQIFAVVREFLPGRMGQFTKAGGSVTELGGKGE